MCSCHFIKCCIIFRARVFLGSFLVLHLLRYTFAYLIPLFVPLGHGEGSTAVTDSAATVRARPTVTVRELSLEAQPTQPRVQLQRDIVRFHVSFYFPSLAWNLLAQWKIHWWEFGQVESVCWFSAKILAFVQLKQKTQPARKGETYIERACVWFTQTNRQVEEKYITWQLNDL